MKIILGLDTSSTSTGWSLFVDNKYQKSGLIDLRKKYKETPERLKYMVVELQNLIDRYSPTTVVIETPVVARNPQTQRLLTTIYGAVYGKCVWDDIQFKDFRPTEWRKLIDSGKKPRKREELKEWSKQKVHTLFGIENIINDDVSDAILIGQAYINKCNGGG